MRKRPWVLTMVAPEASMAQVRAGVEAAERVFASKATTAEEVAAALNAREFDEMSGAFVPQEHWYAGSPPKAVTTDRQMEIADVWFEAEAAALKACYGAEKHPADAELLVQPGLVRPNLQLVE